MTAGAQPVSLSQQADLQPGDTIRTGRNGRVLLVRGEESILIAPNSAIGIPQRAAEGMSTTIVQQAGSILLDVEKRNVQHFEVETPYLAAVVKGTQFRVSVGATGTSVNVLRGRFRSQISNPVRSPSEARPVRHLLCPGQDRACAGPDPCVQPDRTGQAAAVIGRAFDGA